MKAIIFNSGYGNRMGDFTKTHHKSMAPLKNGESIFHRQLRILSAEGVKDFVVTTGPFEEQLKAVAANFPELNFTFVRNEIYDKTNYIYSMYMAREFIDDDMIFLHGDLVFNRKLVHDVLNCEDKNTATVNFSKALPEKDFKGRVHEGKVVEVSIKIFDDDCYAFQPFYKLEKAAASAWVGKVVEFIHILPIAYSIAKLLHPGEKTLYVFADAHHTDMPFSLQRMYEYVKQQGIEPVCHFYDYTHEGAVKSLLHSILFMDIMAQARYVFICDTFLPASSGIKPDKTKLIQLCHYSGPFKRIGYASTDDISGYYSKNIFKNYDLVTASSQMYVPLLTQAMNQPNGVVKALGSSRSDAFFDKEWNERCREEFYQYYPNTQNKKILLWAPTFRGKAANPEALDNQSVLQLQSTLGDEWMVLIKHHPHDDAIARDARYRSNCVIPTERLLPVVDMLITDYSTTVLDYLAYEHPFVLYAPDLEEYEETRGFFVDYRSITKNMTTDKDALPELVKRVYRQWQSGDRSDIARCRKIYTEACDGDSTKRIIDYLYSMDNSLPSDIVRIERR